jgi:hypothetical protein
MDISDGVADPCKDIYKSSEIHFLEEGQGKKTCGASERARAYTGGGEEASWVVVEALGGEDLRAVEEVEEAGHAALVHGPLVVLRAHRHHLLLPPSVSLRLLHSSSVLLRK